MSETIFSEANVGNDCQLSFVSGMTIHLAGNSRDGTHSIGGFLTRLGGWSERGVITIPGGPSIFQLRLGSGGVQPSPM